MECDTKADIFAPPSIGMRLLNVFLPSGIAENEIGDLEEEYRAKVGQEGRSRARRWFWFQVYSTLKVTIKADGVRRILLRGIKRWGGRQLDWAWITRRLWITNGAVSLIIFCLLAPYTIGPQHVELKGGPAHKRITSDPAKIEESSNYNAHRLSPRSEEIIKPSPPTSTFGVPQISQERIERSQQTVASTESFTATAYSLRGRTASGRPVTRGLIAADRRILPLGTRVKLEAGSYSGEYQVADTAGAIRGRKIDIWVPNTDEAMRFGRRPVKLTVLARTRPPTTMSPDEAQKVLEELNSR